MLLCLINEYLNKQLLQDTTNNITTIQMNFTKNYELIKYLYYQLNILIL